MPLTLKLAEITVTFDSFVNSEYPRINIQPLSQVEFSALGTPAIQGSYFESKYLWQFTAYCDRNQRQLIEALAYEFHTRRRNLQEGYVLLYDKTSKIIERNPRTRALVPGTEEQIINGGTHVEFFSQFYSAITDGPKFSATGRTDLITLTLTETVKVNV